MTENLSFRFPVVGNGSGIAQSNRFTREEIQLALRNKGMPLEALRYPITPTGMHYLVVHFDVAEAHEETYQLHVMGSVKKPLHLSLENIKNRPSVKLPVTMECAGNGRALSSPRPISQPWLNEGIGTAEWTGTPLRLILEESGISDDATEIVFTGIDRGVQGNEIQNYQRSLSISEATKNDVLLAYEMNGEPLPPQHGYPLRLLVPGWYGMTSVKWLQNIEVAAQPFKGYQMIKSYRYSMTREDEGYPVSLIKVKALMIPPGIPDFLTRVRLLDAGPVKLAGRAWVGRSEITRVEVRINGGGTWSPARLEPPMAEFAWRGWTFPWDATPGEYILSVRATDREGNQQPVEQFWNYQGMGNNMVQQVKVIVI